MATKPEFLVAKEKMLVALATVSVAISSPEVPGVGFSVAGLDRTKFGFKFQSFLFIVVIVISILLQTAF